VRRRFSVGRPSGRCNNAVHATNWPTFVTPSVSATIWDATRFIAGATRRERRDDPILGNETCVAVLKARLSSFSSASDEIIDVTKRNAEPACIQKLHFERRRDISVNDNNASTNSTGLEREHLASASPRGRAPPLVTNCKVRPATMPYCSSWSTWNSN